MSTVDIRHAHLFCGIGAGAAGFNKAKPSVGTMQGKFRCIGGIDNDAQAIADFGRLTGVPGTVLDLFDRSQYTDFHGHAPPAGWAEAGTANIHRAFNQERPHIVFLSAPCKGFSGLLSEGKSKTDKYQALNRLTLRGVWLLLEAYKDDPVEMVLFENVPRIATRGRALLDQITALLRHYGYAVAETTHDCGEIGGLAQSRKRFLLVARHQAKVPPFLYKPDKKPLRAVGDVLGRLPLPGADVGGPMHRIPALQWKTWVRLAFVEAGGDWRSLNKLAVHDGKLRDYLVVPEFHSGFLGVREWDAAMGTVAAKSRPTNGAFAIADPRHDGPAKHSNEFRICHFDVAAQAVTSAHGSGQAVADPRGPIADKVRGRQFGKNHVADWSKASRTVISGANNGAFAIADPRKQGESFGKYAVTGYSQPAGTVISGSTTGQGAFAVADPRPNMCRAKGDHYLTGGHYGVVPWDRHSYAVASAANLDNGHWTVADPRNLPDGATCTESQTAMPEPADKLVCRITALDGTWHRPFTTLELAALQSLFDPEDWFSPEGGYFTLAGNSDQRWREGIGNAVPSDTAMGIAEVMGETLLLAWAGETFSLSAKPIWVRPVAVAISVHQGLGEML